MVTELFSAMEIAQCTREEKKAPLALILTALRLAEKARKEGLLALDEDLDSLPNPFFRDLVRMVVDGVDSEIIAKLGWIRMSVERMGGADMLAALIALEAALALQAGLNPKVIASMLSSYLGKDRDLFTAHEGKLPWGDKPEPVDSSYFKVCETPEEAIGKISRKRTLSNDERILLNGSKGAEELLDGLEPDIMAVVLSYLDPPRKDEWFRMLSGEKKWKVLEETTLLSSVDPEYITANVRAVLEKVARSLETHSWPAGGLDAALSLFRTMPLHEATEFIDYMEKHQPDLVFEFRAGWFKFEDIAILPDDRAIQKALREVDSATLATALRGSSQAVQDRILANMSMRAGKDLMEDVQRSGTALVSEIAACRKRIGAIFSALEMAGEICLER